MGGLGPRLKSPPPPARADRLKIFTLLPMEQWFGLGLERLICWKWHYRAPFQRAGTCLVDTEQKSSLWQVVLHDYVTRHLQKSADRLLFSFFELNVVQCKNWRLEMGVRGSGGTSISQTSSSYLLVFVRTERIWLKFGKYWEYTLKSVQLI